MQPGALQGYRVTLYRRLNATHDLPFLQVPILLQRRSEGSLYGMTLNWAANRWAACMLYFKAPPHVMQHFLWNAMWKKLSQPAFTKQIHEMSLEPPHSVLNSVLWPGMVCDHKQTFCVELPAHTDRQMTDRRPQYTELHRQDAWLSLQGQAYVHCKKICVVSTSL